MRVMDNGGGNMAKGVQEGEMNGRDLGERKGSNDGWE